MSTNDDGVTVYLVDDDASVLRAYSRVIRSAGWQVAAFESPHEFLQQLDLGARGCIILDYAMPDVTGLQVQETLRLRGCHLPVIYLTAHGDVPLSVDAMKAGAADFLCKPCDAEQLLDAIRKAIESERQFRAQYGDAIEFAERLHTLSPREYEVFRWVVAGKLNKQIAASLGTVEKTVKVHRGRVMRKLAVSSLAEMVRLYEQARHLNESA